MFLDRGAGTEVVKWLIVI